MKKALYRSIPCYYDEETNEIEGRSWFYDILIDSRPLTITSIIKDIASEIVIIDRKKK